MNFELKSLDLAACAAEKCDALIVLVSEAFLPGKGALSQLIAQACTSGDLESKPGKLLQMYRPAAAAATRVLLVGVGDGSVRHVRQAVATAVAAAKGPALHKILISFAAAA